MAILIPEKPKEFIKYSKEDLMFEALKALPDSYYVFHSFKIVTVENNNIYESETDFVIYNKHKGILCIEAKSGNVKYENGEWKYGSNVVMSHDGPFNQASSNKWKLINYFNQQNMGEFLKRCKILHAVWFVDIPENKLNAINIPSEANRNIILTKDSLVNIEKDISRIFDISLPNGIVTNLLESDSKQILNRILAPQFNLISIAEIKYNQKNEVFKRLLDEQIALLNYLEEQKIAVINGMAGTGKTVIALEKAKRHAIKNEKVLFLCYNKYLKEYLKNNYFNANIDYYTIDGLACKLCNMSKPDYQTLSDVLLNMSENNSFPYKHVIIDEGQDFGKDNIDESDIIELLKMNVYDNKFVDGTFYLFYDKNQMVQSKNIPKYIEESECKLTLYKNCRNTINIARTSLRFLGNDKKVNVYDGAIVGEQTELYFANDKEKYISILNNIIDSLWEKQYKDIQILTCKTVDESIIQGECDSNIYFYKGKKIPFTTCRKFKGLESEAIILVDVDEQIMDNEFAQILYVGASRAKFKLQIISCINNSNCESVIDYLGGRKSNNNFKSLATLLNAKYMEKSV